MQFTEKNSSPTRGEPNVHTPTTFDVCPEASAVSSGFRGQGLGFKVFG
jgi:hypothetical protein